MNGYILQITPYRSTGVRAIAWANLAARGSTVPQTRLRRRGDRRSETDGKAYARGTNGYRPAPAISEIGRAQYPAAPPGRLAWLQLHPQTALPLPDLPCRDTSPLAASNLPRNNRPAEARASRLGGTTTRTPAELLKVPGRQRPVRAAHGGQEPCRQFARIVFRRIVMVAEIAQRLSHHFARVRVAARTDLSGHEFFQVLCQGYAHVRLMQRLQPSPEPVNP